MTYPIPPNDRERLAVLNEYGVVGTPPEANFDEITELAGHICDCPVSVVNLIADEWEWYKGKFGVPDKVNCEPRGGFCSWTICSNDLLIVPDLSKEEDFAHHDVVKGRPHFRFYAGSPLVNPDGFVLGTLCVLDHKPRELSREQLSALRCLTHQAVAQLELRRSLAKLDEARRGLAEERARAEHLLRNVLPEEIAEELKLRGRVQPQYYDSATILFTDFQGFTRLAERLEPRELIDELNDHFSAFDEIISRHGLEKLKTIGDAYMCVGGLPERNNQHAQDACAAALEIRDHMARINNARDRAGLPIWNIRIGVHTGGVIAGVIGRKRFTYDIWGDAVNVAALVEAHAAPNQILISESTRRYVRDDFDMEAWEAIETTKKGRISCHILCGAKS